MRLTAIVGANAAARSGTPQSEAGAAAGAAGTVLAGIHPQEQSAIDAQLAADALAQQNQRDAMETARMLAMMHVAAMDASIGCWDAKYTYWYIRPYQADAAITTPVGRPNFPSYPSAAYAAVLSGLFPAASSNLTAQLDEAGVSRIYAGLHFRLDIGAGQQIGKSTAALALAAVQTGVAIPLK